LLDVVPDLAVEVLSRGNRPGEMKRKLRDYFLAGIAVVWFINPRTRTAEVYTSPEKRKRLGEGDSLEGGDLIPGFTLPLTELFEVLAE
jgi:Uma2 family endonuclease